jgi:hypothetical protein
VSDDCVTVVEISIGPLEAADRADAVVQWLLETGVVVANTDRGQWQPSAYRPGPRVHSVVPSWHEHDYTLANNGVDVMVERQLYHSLEAYRPPACPACGHRLDEAAHDTFATPWLAGREPAVTCPACGATNPLGDWPDSYQVGELAVSFHNWPPLAEEFLAELGGRMGPRWRVVHEHY